MKCGRLWKATRVLMAAMGIVKQRHSHTSMTDKHIRLERIWEYSCGNAVLDQAEQEHLYECALCTKVLGKCAISRSIDEAKGELAKRHLS